MNRCCKLHKLSNIDDRLFPQIDVTFFEKGGQIMDKKNESESDNVLKCGKRTYFFDVREARNGSTYLRITESQFVKEGEEHRRNSFILFKDDLAGFTEKIQNLGKNLVNSAPSGKKKKE